MRCPHCGAVIVDNRRSQPQSNTVHKAIRAYCDATGEPFDLVKVKWKFHVGAYVSVPVDSDALASWIPPPWPGRFVQTGGMVYYRGAVLPEFVFLKSEASYSKDEEARLIDHAREECERVDADLSWMEG